MHDLFENGIESCKYDSWLATFAERAANEMTCTRFASHCVCVCVCDYYRMHVQDLHGNTQRGMYMQYSPLNTGTRRDGTGHCEGKWQMKF